MHNCLKTCIVFNGQQGAPHVGAKTLLGVYKSLGKQPLALLLCQLSKPFSRDFMSSTLSLSLYLIKYYFLF